MPTLSAMYSMTEVVPVKTKPAYDVVVGHSDELTDRLSTLKDLLPGNKIGIVTNPRLRKLYLPAVKSGLENLGFQVSVFQMKEGERYKNYEYAGTFYPKLLKADFDRSACLLALGGGVIGDFTGYLAASYLRGISFVQMPTSFLASVDASVGGKVAVNIGSGKNMVGAFYQPKLVAIMTDWFATLPNKEWGTGWAEVIKHGLIGDKALFGYLAKNREGLKERSEEVVRKAVIHSVKLKSKVVSRDEKEGGLRQILNFGHTVGHAIESIQKYEGLGHGEAVAVGIISALLLSEKKLNLDPGVRGQTVELFEAAGLPLWVDLPPAKIARHTRFDKKRVAGKTPFVLLKAIGESVFGQPVSEGELTDVLKDQQRLYGRG